MGSLQGGVPQPSPTRSAQSRRADGRVKYEMHYTAGLLADAGPHIPAVRGFYANGAKHYEERYVDGRRHDGGLGEAAVRKWRADGTLRHELHYHHGIRIPRN